MASELPFERHFYNGGNSTDKILKGIALILLGITISLGAVIDLAFCWVIGLLMGWQACYLPSLTEEEKT